ncbi:ATP-binding cassette subfamily B protein [Plantactinospora soyae]|uniref:ATP-binding cassette subfamily B protein n=2 Tax=Plantactinospora soyae TaxID=1544732 RepID=A0A927MAA0_9ACTN|nr:ATP-binding cassette subfamily B protein [Plantactinospora soyae]
MPLLRGRLMLLGALRHAGAGSVGALSVAYAVSALIPAASAAAMGLLIGHVQLAVGGLSSAALPLALFVVVLLLGHLVDAAIEPLRYLVRTRIDGAHRAEVASLAAAVPSLDRLEDPQVRDRIRLVAADPGNWTEKTPGDGALAQLHLLARYVGAAGAAAVLAAYAWWLIPLLAVPALVGRAVRSRDFVKLARLWAQGVRQGRRADYWKHLVMSPAVGKEQRVYGFGEWAVDRVAQGIHASLDPVWAFNRRLWRRSTATAAIMFVPLAIGYAAVAHAVTQGNTTAAVQTAVFAAGLGVYLAVGGTFDESGDIEGALPVLQAMARLREEFGTSHFPGGLTRVLPPMSNGRAGTRSDGAVPTRTPLVELSGIRFAYPGTGRPVLDGLNLTIHPHELLAVVGLNGTGKSTLIKLLAGLYEPDAGRITADGVDIRQLGIGAWQQRLSVVFQDFVRYEMSVADNVTLGNGVVPPNSSARKRAAAEAGLEHLLARLPDGWRTPLARGRSGGVDLSGGQWQQVVLARALYAVHTGARVLVLDEPTAHLDVRSEFELFGRLLARPGRASVVLISHRLSTVRRADRIVLLDGGRVAECGTHEELIRLDGSYAAMFRIQAQRFTHGYDDRIDSEPM